MIVPNNIVLLVKRGDVFSFTQDTVTIPVLNDGNEHHVAITRRGTLVCFFVDGEVVGGIEMSNDLISVDGDNRIGRSHFTPVDFNGTVRDFKIWNYAFPFSEIRNIYEQG